MRALILAAMIAAVCSAQAGRVEVRGDVGWTGFLDESSDNHRLFGGSAKAYLTRRIAVQPELQYLRRESRHSDVVFLGNVVFDTRSPGARVVPYFIVGPGVIRTNDRSSNKGLFVSGGFGVRVQVTDRWYVAPDFRTGVEPHIRFSVGVGYVWRR